MNEESGPKAAPEIPDRRGRESQGERTIPRRRDPFTSPPGFVSFDEAVDEQLDVVYFDAEAGDFVPVREARRRIAAQLRVDERERFGGLTWRGHRIRVACEVALFRLRQGRDDTAVLGELLDRLEPLRRQAAA